MKKYLPLLSLLLILGVGVYLVVKKRGVSHEVSNTEKKIDFIGIFDHAPACARPPIFLQRLEIAQPVIIDLSQKEYKGIVLRYGTDFKNIYHPLQWEQFGHLGTYVLDEKGNIYLAPIPFISITATTFNLQKNIYRVDSRTGKLALFLSLDDVNPSSSNPYGITAVAYDCEDHSLWVAAIDESDYQTQKGVIYHIDSKSKEILQRIEGRDILSLALLKGSKGKFLLAGSARDNALYAYPVSNQQLQNKPIKLLELPFANEHIRKIKIKGKNLLELQAIPFSYALIAQSAEKERSYYHAQWDQAEKLWRVKMIKE